MTLVKGTISKLDRRGLAPDAQVVVTIADVSRADAPQSVLAQRKFALGGQQLPLEFRLPLRADSLKSNRNHVIRAQVFEGGQLRYTTDTAIPVTRQHLAVPFDLRVVAAR